MEGQIRSLVERRQAQTEYEEFNSQEKPGEAQCVGGLNCLLSNDKAVYAVGEVCSKGQNAQHRRWRHEHPGMLVKRHGGVIGLAEERSPCVRTLADVIAAR